MVPNLKLAKNMIKLHRRGGGSVSAIDLCQTGLKNNVAWHLFLSSVILKYLGQFRRCLLQCVASFLDTCAHKSTKLSLNLLIYFTDKPFAASNHF